MYARILYGAAAILYSVVSLVWHDSDLQGRLAPLHALMMPAVWCIVIVEIAGAVAIVFPRTMRLGAIVLGAIYGLHALAALSDIVMAPGAPGGYINFFELLAIVCGALAVFAATEAAARAELLGGAARVALGASSASFAWAQVVYLQYTASLVPAWISLNAVFLTNVTTVAFALAAIAMLVNRQAILAMKLLALMIALFGMLVWVPIIAAKPATLANWGEISENYLIAAAAWLLAGLLGARTASGKTPQAAN